MFYTTVEEVKPKFGALRAFLLTLKTDLKIGKDGYPAHVVLVGDEQIYDILKKIQHYDDDQQNPSFD